MIPYPAFTASLSELSDLAAGADAGVVGSGSVSMLLFYVGMALGISFLCSLLEAGLLSASPSYIELMAQAGKRSGLLMRRHKENVERPISAILTLNTIAHTVGAASAGAEAASVFGGEWTGLISAVLTLLILVLSEIVPKTLGVAYWKPLMPFVAYVTHWLTIVFTPAVTAFEGLGRLLTPATQEKDPETMRSELELMAQLSGEEGALEPTEQLIFKNVLRLDSVPIRDIMTPRTVMFALPERLTVGEAMQKHPLIPYSRIPLYKDNYDSISQFVLRFDLLAAAARDQDHLPITAFARPLLTIPETLSVSRTLEQFIKTKQHIFLIFDEFGGTSGLLTMEDVIESLLGVEITDESDIAEDLRTLAEQRYTRKREVLKLFSEEQHSDTANADANTPS